MESEFTGIERRLDELSERLSRLIVLSRKNRDEFDSDPLLRDIAERNLEVAAQCCIDICHRLIAIENARKPQDYFDAFIILGEIGVLPPVFARKIAPLAGLRNILTHEYLWIDWDHVFLNLKKTDDLQAFYDHIRKWLEPKEKQ